MSAHNDSSNRADLLAFELRIAAEALRNVSGELSAGGLDALTEVRQLLAEMEDRQARARRRARLAEFDDPTTRKGR